jgi:hypothetical protein
MAKGFFRRVSLIFDREAGQRMEEDTAASMARAGQAGGAAISQEMADAGRKAARELTQNLTAEYNKTISQAKVDLAKGLIDEKQFARIRTEADRTFNKALVEGMERIRGEGKLTDAQFEQLSRRIKRVGTEAPKDLGLVERGIDRIKSAALGMAAGFVALFAFSKIKQFGQESLAAAEQLVQGQRRLEAQVERTGVAWETAEGQIKATTDQLWDTHRLTGGEVDAILQRLIATTNDYEGSLDRVGLVADVAKGRQIDQAAAADLVAKAMNGNVTALRKLGIEASSGEEALALLEQRFGGMAKESTTSTEVWAKVMGDLREEIGLAMMEAGGGTSAIETMAGVVRGLTRWIAENREGITRWVGTGINVAVGAVRFLVDGVQNLADAIAGSMLWSLGKGAAALAMITDGFVMAADAKAKFYGLFSAAAAARAKAEADSLRDRAAALRRYAEAADEASAAAFDSLGNRNRMRRDRADASAPEAARRRVTDPAAAVAGGEESAAGTGRAARAERGRSEGERTERERDPRAVLREEIRLLQQGVRLRALTAEETARITELESALREKLEAGNLPLDERLETIEQLHALGDLQAELLYEPLFEHNAAAIAAHQALVDSIQERLQPLQGFMETVAFDMADSWQQAFGLILDDAETLTGALELVGRGMAASVAGGIADIARQKVGENVASSIEQFAKGLGAASNPLTAAMAPGHFASAAKHVGAAAAWGALAGGSGAAASALASGGGGGRVPSAGRDAGLATAQAAERPRHITNIRVDGIDPRNPRHGNLVWETVGAAAERHGGEVYLNGQKSG